MKNFIGGKKIYIYINIKYKNYSQNKEEMRNIFQNNYKNGKLARMATKSMPESCEWTGLRPINFE